MSKEIPVTSSKYACGCSKKGFIASMSAVAFVVIGLAVGLGVYFGIFYGKSSASLTIGQVASSQSFSVTKRDFARLNKRATFSVSSTFKSSTSYSVAEVVGLRLYVISVALTPSAVGGNIESTSFATDKIVEVGSGVSTNLTAPLTLPNGTYTKAAVRVRNHYGLKAYCKTSTKLVYTSSTGIKTVT